MLIYIVILGVILLALKKLKYFVLLAALLWILNKYEKSKVKQETAARKWRRIEYKKSVNKFMHSAIAEAVFEKIEKEVERRDEVELLDEVVIHPDHVRLSFLTGKVIHQDERYEVVTSDCCFTLQELGCQNFANHDDEQFFAVALAKMMKSDGTEYIVMESKKEEDRIPTQNAFATVIQSKYACAVGLQLCKLCREGIQPQKKGGFFWYEEES